MPHDLITRHDLALRDPFGLSRGATSMIPVFHVQTAEGGTGCGSPVRYHGETADEGARQARELLASLSPADRQEPAHWEERLRASTACACARAAVDMALHDALCRSRGLAVGEGLGVAPVHEAPSLFTIAIEDDAKMVEKVQRATWAPRLKVKLGRNDAVTDGRTLRAVRGAAPGKPILVDANAGWSRQVAREMLAICADLGVHLVEQPLAIGDIEGLRQLRRDAPVPFVVDEDAQTSADLPALRGAVHGINIKLMKCGGLAEALRMADFARAEGWVVMLGCMIESSVGIAAAAHVASIAQELDLDAEALIMSNPAGPPVLSPEGLLTTPGGPGLGATLLP